MSTQDRNQQQGGQQNQREQQRWDSQDQHRQGHENPRDQQRERQQNQHAKETPMKIGIEKTPAKTNATKILPVGTIGLKRNKRQLIKVSTIPTNQKRPRKVSCPWINNWH